MENQNLPSLTPSLPLIAPTERASFWKRFFALFIDLFILGIINGCLNFFIDPNWWPAGRGIILGAIPAIYFIIFYSTSGQTLGKNILKIRVVATDGSRLNLGKGIIRTFGYIPSLIPFYLGFLWSLRDDSRQAWHDKMAGTYVVPAYITREQFQATMEPREVRRRQLRWLLGLGIPTILIVIIGYSASIALINRGVAEVRAMEPWPGSMAHPEELARVDLTHLGLRMGKMLDARNQEKWADGSYDFGVMATYLAETKEVVAIWVLRYPDSQSAGNEFRSIQASISEATVCGFSSYAYIGTTGVIHCQYSDAYEKLFWNDNWIVNLVALGTNVSPNILIDQVRDAMAENWSTIETP